MKLFISAVETSSDHHAAELIKALKKLYPENLKLIGLGGKEMEAQGFQSLHPIHEISVMGFSEVLPKLLKNISVFLKIISVIKTDKPDAIVLLDYPGFHLKLAKKIYEKIGIPVVYYIPPKVWAWKKKRIFNIKKYCDLVLLVFPFEIPFYKKYKVPHVFIGNPLLDQLPLQKTKAEARSELGLSNAFLVISVLLGSRWQEVNAHFKVVIEGVMLSISSLQEREKVSVENPLTLVCPIPKNLDRFLIEKMCLQYFSEKYKNDPNQNLVRFLFIEGHSHKAMLAADCGLIKSGTSTLEASLLGCPYALFYRLSNFSEFIVKRIIRYTKPVGLSNLVLGIEVRSEAPYRELLGLHGFTPQSISKAVLELLFSEKKINELNKASQKTRALFTQKKPPSEYVAEVLMDFIQKRKQRCLLGNEGNPSKSFLKRIGFKTVSLVWSSLNWIRRDVIYRFFLKPRKIIPKVYSVGNLQAGGSGKTPFTISLAQKLIKEGKNGVVLTRGYRSQVEKTGAILAPFQKGVSATQYGDEPTLLHEKVPEVWVGIGQNRLRNFLEIEKKSQKKIDFVILEDGFQNFQIQKDVDIVLVTSQTSNEILFRDFFSALKKADRVFWTKGEKRPLVPAGVELMELNYQIVSEGTLLASDEVVLVTAVANNEKVKDYFKVRGIPIKEHLMFEDHYSYSDLSIQNKIREYIQLKNKIAVTEKDWMKLRDYFMKEQGSFIKLDLHLDCEIK